MHTYIFGRAWKQDCFGVNAAEWQHRAACSSVDNPLARANHRFACPRLGALGRLISSVIKGTAILRRQPSQQRRTHDFFNSPQRETDDPRECMPTDAHLCPISTFL